MTLRHINPGSIEWLEAMTVERYPEVALSVEVAADFRQRREAQRLAYLAQAALQPAFGPAARHADRERVAHPRLRLLHSDDWADVKTRGRS